MLKPCTPRQSDATPHEARNTPPNHLFPPQTGSVPRTPLARRSAQRRSPRKGGCPPLTTPPLASPAFVPPPPSRRDVSRVPSTRAPQTPRAFAIRRPVTRKGEKQPGRRGAMCPARLVVASAGPPFVGYERGRGAVGSARARGGRANRRASDGRRSSGRTPSVGAGGWARARS